MKQGTTCPNCGKQFKGRTIGQHINAGCGVTPEQLFWQKVDKSAGTDKCWPWTAAITSWRYGHFRSSTLGEWMSHKLAWVLTNGPVPGGLQVLHRCDNPPCCNPGHLFLGTNADNMRDKVAKGRQHKGSQLVHAKLNEEQAKEILQRKPPKSHVRGLAKAIAAQYGVGTGAVHAIWRGSYWRHIQNG